MDQQGKGRDDRWDPRTAPREAHANPAGPQVDRGVPWCRQAPGAREGWSSACLLSSYQGLGRPRGCQRQNVAGPRMVLDVGGGKLQVVCLKQWMLKPHELWVPG